MKKIVLVVLLLGVTALATNVFDWVKIRKPDGSPGLPMKYGSDTIVRPCTFLRDTNALNIYHGVDSGYFGIGHNGAKTTWLTSILQQDKDTLKSHSMTLSNRFGLGANFNFTVYQFDMPNGRMHVMDSGAGGWAIFAEESYYMGGGAIYGKAYSDIGVKGHFCGPGTPAYAVFGYCDSGGIAVGGIDTGWNEGIGGYFLGKKYGCQASGDTYDFYGEWKSYLDSLKTHIASAVLKAEADSDVVACALLADYAYNDSASRRINDSIARFADSLAAKLPLHGKADSAVLSDLSDSCTGGAVRAAKLTTARTIGGVSFDGTANIIPDTCKRSGTCAVADSAAKVKIPLHLYSASRDTLLSFDEVATNAHPQVLWKINTADTGTADFSMMYWPRNNPYGTQLDGIFYWGYNIGSNCGLNCGAQDITKPSGSMRIESNYRPGIGGQIMEIGFEVLKPDSQTAYRPFYILLNRITDSITVTQQASSYEWMAIQNAGDTSA